MAGASGDHLRMASSSARSSSSAGCVGWCWLPCTTSLCCVSGTALPPPAAPAAAPEVAASALPACTEGFASCAAPGCSVLCLNGRCCCFCGVSARPWLQSGGDAASTPLPPLPTPPAAPPVADDGSDPWDASCGVAASGTVARLCASTLAMPAPVDMAAVSRLGIHLALAIDSKTAGASQPGALHTTSTARCNGPSNQKHFNAVKVMAANLGSRRHRRPPCAAASPGPRPQRLPGPAGPRRPRRRWAPAAGRAHADPSRCRRPAGIKGTPHVTRDQRHGILAPHAPRWVVCRYPGCCHQSARPFGLADAIRSLPHS
jgi:hypothetical protein